MKECKYCNFATNGDIPEDRLDLISAYDTIRLPVKTDVTINAFETTVEKTIEMSVDVGIYNSLRTKSHVLSLLLWSNEMQEELETDANPNGDIYSSEIEINYCPMCGRKLNKSSPM